MTARVSYRCFLCRRFRKRLGRCGKVNDLMGRVYDHKLHCFQCCFAGHGRDHRHVAWRQEVP